MSAARNIRLGWIAQELASGKSNAQIVLDCMARFKGVSEKVARKDLKEILQRLTEIELECLPEVKTRMMEVGWKLLEEARKLGQYGPAVNQFKTMAIMSGALDEKKESKQENTGTPENAIIRERISQLMKSKRLQEDAKAAGIDLEALKDGQE